MLALKSQLPNDWKYEFLEAPMEPSTLILRKLYVEDQKPHGPLSRLGTNH